MRTFAFLLPALLLILLLSGAPEALAHGKSLKIGLSSSPAGPEAKTYTASVKYAGDGDPVIGAIVTLRAEKTSGKPQWIDPTTLTATKPGVYENTVEFPSGGTWAARLEVSGDGQGFVAFTEEINPAESAAESTSSGSPPSQAGAAETAVPGALDPEHAEGITKRPQAPEAFQGQTPSSLTVTLGLGLSDALDLAVRVAHILAAIMWIGGLAFLLLILRPMPGETSTEQSNVRLAETYRRFGNVAGVSLAVLVGTGAYNAVFNAPSPGGIFNLESVGNNPFGGAWLGLLELKVAVVAVMVAVAAFMRLRLVPLLTAKTSPNPGPEHAAEQAARARLTLRRLSTINLILGCLVILLAAALAYLHLVGHF